MDGLKDPRLWLWLAGAIQAGIVLANLPLPARLRVREGIAPLPRFLRQVFIVHWIYIVLTVALFSALCFIFPRELAGASPLGRFLSGFLAFFWGLRIVLQLLYYDAGVRRQHRVLDICYLVGLCALAGILVAAASGALV
ncbi:MAG TPA: hypothetical protein VE825_09955 [Terriglobales bacterium]|jgi:hypothetical protein|nr:hypothetical protein [Terriglobales bacterium]